MKIFVSQSNWREYKIYIRYFGILTKYIGKATVSLNGNIQISSKRKLKPETVRKVKSAVKTHNLCKGIK